MYPFPIKLLEGQHLIMTQSFHVAEPTDISNALKIQTTDHLGVDVVCGTNEETWGKPCVWTLPWPGVVYEALVDSPFGATQHAHSQIDTTDPTTGIHYSVIYLHLSSVTDSKAATEKKVIVYKEGDVIGHIGNNGDVNPPPTPSEPLQGSHLHLGLASRRPEDLNATMIDPLTLFDLTKPFIDEQLPSDKIAVLASQDAAQGNTRMADILSKIVAFLKSFGS